MARKKFAEKLCIRLNRSNLDRIIITLLTHPTNKKFARSVDDLLAMMDLSVYRDDIERYLRIELAKKISRLINQFDLTTTEMILSAIELDGKDEERMKEILDNLSQYELTPPELEATDRMVANQLKFGILKNNARNVIDFMTDLETDTYEDFGAVIKKAETELGDMYKMLRKASESMTLNRYDLKLDVESLRATTPSYLAEKRAADYFVKTGIQDLNTMLSGGWQRGKLYCLFAPKKSGKSMFMLNSCIWAQKYNDFDMSDGKRPVIVLLSMENTTTQQRDRLWKWINGNKSDVAKVTEEEYIGTLIKSGIVPTDPRKPRIDFLYRANQSISTEDLMGILEDYEANGEKVVFLALDYMGRIRAANKDAQGAEEYTVLSFVSNELVDIARIKNIPILTAAQMNRLAMEGIDKAGDDFMKKMEAAKKSTSSNVQGSFRITQNVDYGFALSFLERTEKVAEGDLMNGYVPKKEQYFFLKLTECRDDSPAITQFFHPLAPNNGCRYIEDVKMARKKSFQSVELESAVMTAEYNNLPVSGSTKTGDVRIIRMDDD